MTTDEAHTRRLEEQLAKARELLQQHLFERVEAEEALRASEERFKALIERAAYGICLVAHAGHFIEVNPALVSMLEYPDVESFRARELWTEIFQDADEGYRVRDEAMAGRLPTWIETRWRRHDGTPLTVRLSLRAVHGPSGEVTLYEGIAEDVTERRRQEELLRRSERMATLGSTIAGVAHELNNPLAAIMGFAQILLGRPLSEEDHAAVQTINEEAIRTSRIVRDLLTLLRRREQEDRVPLDLNDVAGHVVRSRAGMAVGMTLELDLAGSLPAVLGDRSQLEQVVAHLLDNAIQAVRDAGRAPRRQRVAVRTRHDAEDVVLEVEDTGGGIPDEALPRIWDPFWTTRDEGRGTGLGLSVVHSIVTHHGGFVDAHNVPGGGARFTVRIPAMREEWPEMVTVQ